MTLKSTELADLEQMIDSHGLAAVLGGLAQICGEKADHVRSDWQDATLARLWAEAAKRIDSAVASKSIQVLPS